MLPYLYEMVVGLKINFMKSEIFLTNGDEETAFQYANFFIANQNISYEVFRCSCESKQTSSCWLGYFERKIRQEIGSLEGSRVLFLVLAQLL